MASDAASSAVDNDAETASALTGLYAAKSALERYNAAGKPEAQAASALEALERIHASVASKADLTRQFAAQSMAITFEAFPEKQKTTWDHLLDMCEDTDHLVRENAIVALGVVAHKSIDYATRCCAILVQLLSVPSAAEVNLAKKTLLDVMKLNLAGAFDMLAKELQQDGEGAQGAQQTSLLATFFLSQLRSHSGEIKKDPLLQAVLGKNLKSVIAHAKLEPVAYEGFMQHLSRLDYPEKEADLNQLLSQLLKPESFKPEDPACAAAFSSSARLARSPETVSSLFSFFASHIVPVTAQLPVDMRRSYFLQAVGLARRQASEELANAVLPWVAKLLPEWVPETYEEPAPVAAAAGSSEAPANGDEAAPAEATDASAAAAPSEPKPAADSALPGDKLDYGLIDALLTLIHILGPHSPRLMKLQFALFHATGQPSDFRPDIVEQRKAFQERMNKLAGVIEAQIVRVAAALTDLRPKSQACTKLSRADPENAALAKEAEQSTSTLKSLEQALRSLRSVQELARALGKPNFSFVERVKTAGGGRGGRGRGKPGQERQGGGKNRQSKQQQQQQKGGSTVSGRMAADKADSGNGRRRRGGGGGGGSQQQQRGQRGQNQQQGQQQQSGGGRRGRKRGQQQNGQQQSSGGGGGGGSGSRAQSGNSRPRKRRR